MLKKAIMFLLLFVSVTIFGEINAKLSFSLDNGKTWDTDFPLLKKAQEVMVKVNWNVIESKKINRGVLTTNLYSTERDFASSNRGKQYNWVPGRKGAAWFQQLKRYYAGAQKPFPFVYRLDLGARKAGVVGKGNKWDKKVKKFIDAPLPACAAYGPGTYRFNISLGYRLKKSKELVKVVKEFDITIEGKKKAASPKSVKKKSNF